MATFRTYSGVAFRKMHGAGNDFVVLDQRDGGPAVSAKLARSLGDRHRGVGFDQLAVLTANPTGPALTFFNTDGSQAGACGNATRCVADWLMQASDMQTLEITTARGRLQAERTSSGQVAVNMGQPLFNWRDIPLTHTCDTAALPLDCAPMAVSMGNPHCVFVVDDADVIDPADRGPAVEGDPLFAEGANVEFISKLGSDHLRMRVWERGTGVTLACGSGACAAAVVATKRGLTGRQIKITVDGGVLHVDWRDDGVWLSGPTVHVFDGVLTDDFLDSLE